MDDVRIDGNCEINLHTERGFELNRKGYSKG